MFGPSANAGAKKKEMRKGEKQIYDENQTTIMYYTLAAAITTVWCS